MFDNEGNFYNVAYGIDTTWSFVSVDMFEELGISAAASDAEFLENCRVAEEVGLVGALAKRDREDIGLTAILCSDNQGVRYIERIGSDMQLELDGASR